MVKNTGRKVLVIFTGMLLISKFEFDVMSVLFDVMSVLFDVMSANLTIKATLIVGAIIADNTPNNENQSDGLFDGSNHENHRNHENHDSSRSSNNENLEKRINAFVGAEIILDTNSDTESTYAINFDELEKDYQLNVSINNPTRHDTTSLFRST